jgi:magnesium transporter
VTVFERRFPRPGTSPGWLGEPGEDASASQIRVLRYGRGECEELETESVEQAFSMLDAEHVTWIDVVGLGDLKVLHTLEHDLGIHPLVLEDLVNVGQRPKFEAQEEYLFLILRLQHRVEALRAEQVGILVGPHWVVTVQQVEEDCFDVVRERIRSGAPRISVGGADYLAYALVDAIVDHFYPLLESYGERIEELEEELNRQATPETLQRIHQLKKDLMIMRRAAWPQREVVLAFERLESPLLRSETVIFLRDCYDHALQIIDLVDNYREHAADLKDLYMSTVSHRMNEIMKILTITATVFIPLTFVAGIYGMNFDPAASPFNMPELRWRWGYPGALLVMLAVAGGMLFFFRRKKWL